MSKTKTQSKALTLPTVDPRVRMKEVRALVAKAHKQGQRIDLMGFEGDDIARSQIALQDLLSNEQKRHAKARGHIVDQKKTIQIIGEMMAFISDHSTERLLRDQERMAQYATALRREQKLHGMANDAVAELMTDNEQLTADLEATMNSLRVALNGSTNG